MFRSFVDHVFRVHPRACADQRLVAIESETGSESRIGGLIVAKPEAKQRRLRALANLLGCAQEPAGLLRFPEQLSDVATAFHRPCDTPQMCNGKGIAHGFMPLESRRGDVTMAEQRKTDIHSDKVMHCSGKVTSPRRLSSGMKPCAMPLPLHICGVSQGRWKAVATSLSCSGKRSKPAGS